MCKSSLSFVTFKHNHDVYVNTHIYNYVDHIPYSRLPKKKLKQNDLQTPTVLTLSYVSHHALPSLYVIVFQYGVCLFVCSVSRGLLFLLLMVHTQVVDANSNFAHTKLSSAAEGNRIKEVEALIKYGANVNVQAEVRFLFFVCFFFHTLCQRFSEWQIHIVFSDVKTTGWIYTLVLRSFQKKY
jgi:hypothetical protein